MIGFTINTTVGCVHIFYKSQILFLSVLKKGLIHYRREKSWIEAILIITYLNVT